VEFSPNNIAEKNGNFLGLPVNEEDAGLVILSIPWDVTTSSKAGTSKSHKNILENSYQIDLYNEINPNAWKKGIFLKKPDSKLLKINSELRTKAEQYIEFLEKGGKVDESIEMKSILEEINKASEYLNFSVYSESLKLLNKGKKVALLGGDHSTPLGLLQALTEKYDALGILHIDAHMDLRFEYEGFKFSHASIMNNVLSLDNIKKIVQVSIRDYCEEEIEIAKKQQSRIVQFTDSAIKEAGFEGKIFKTICNEIISQLPENVYISFDIDGLSPQLCPNTGTPVPGGLNYEEAVYLLKILKKSGKNIIGFDLNEVASEQNSLDGSVGARMLYNLICTSL
jgi:agmatinase